MGFVRTINGDIKPEEMGFTYSHEHIVCIPPLWKVKGEDDLLLDDEEKSLKDIMDFKNAGGMTIVDATAVDYGRDVYAVKRISEKSGVNIIGTAGFNKGLLWPAPLKESLKKIVGPYKTYYEWIDDWDVFKLADYIIKEIEEGLEGTNIKGGQIKFGTGYNSISPLEIKIMKAAIIAHKETKAPVHSHTEAGTMALEQIEILKSFGMDISFVSFGHMDRNIDPYYYRKIASNGAYLCFDGIGKIKYAPESARINAILDLVEDGYGRRILISGDTARKSYFKHYGYGLGFEYIINKWTARLKEEANVRGLDGDKIIEDFFINNPKECMTFKV